MHLGQTSETVGGGNRGLSGNQTTGVDIRTFKNSCFEFSILHSFSPLFPHPIFSYIIIIYYCFIHIIYMYVCMYIYIYIYIYIYMLVSEVGLYK